MTLVVGANRVYSGSMDHSIKVGCFRHKTHCRFFFQNDFVDVITISSCCRYLFSFDVSQYLQVWDLETLRCLQTLTEHIDVVMSLLCWDQFLLSASLDKTVKVCVSVN